MTVLSCKCSTGIGEICLSRFSSTAQARAQLSAPLLLRLQVDALLKQIRQTRLLCLDFFFYSILFFSCWEEELSQGGSQLKITKLKTWLL